MDEIFTPMIGHEREYLISNTGDCITLHDRWGSVRKMSRVGHSGGYDRYRLTGLGGHSMAYVHRVVWESFHGPIPDGYEINHKDCNKKNNRIDNLELVTHKENMDHAVRVKGEWRKGGRPC